MRSRARGGEVDRGAAGRERELDRVVVDLDRVEGLRAQAREERERRAHDRERRPADVAEADEIIR